MSILNPTKPKVPTVPELERQVQQTASLAARLSEEVRALAALVPLDQDDGPELRAYREKCAERDAAENKVRRLNDAIQGAVAREAAELSARQSAVRKTQIESRKRDATTLCKLAEEFATAEATSNRLYQEMFDVAAKLIVPVAGIKTPDGAIHPGRIIQLVIAERFRLSAPFRGDSINGDKRRLLPGAGSPDVYLDDQPNKIVPFADAVRAETADLINRLKEQAK